MKGKVEVGRGIEGWRVGTFFKYMYVLHSLATACNTSPKPWACLCLIDRDSHKCLNNGDGKDAVTLAIADIADPRTSATLARTRRGDIEQGFAITSVVILDPNASGTTTTWSRDTIGSDIIPCCSGRTTKHEGWNLAWFELFCSVQDGSLHQSLPTVAIPLHSGNLAFPLQQHLTAACRS